MQHLDPTYEGDLQVGDQVLRVPRHTGAISVTASPFAHTTVTSGLTYVGRQTSHDFLALFRCIAGTGPCEASFRGYQTSLRPYAKVNLMLSHDIAPAVGGFISVENLTNNTADEINNSVPAEGRLTTVGVRITY